MAANGARRTLYFSSASIKSILSHSATTNAASKSSNLKGLASSKSISPSRFSSCRVPVELSGMLSLMPLHSVTAAALFTSLLSLNNEHWGCLSEGFATPL